MNYIVSSGRKDVIFFDIIESEEAAGCLVKVGGKRQVPCPRKAGAIKKLSLIEGPIREPSPD